jgi:hypothetical protein
MQGLARWSQVLEYASVLALFIEIFRFSVFTSRTGGIGTGWILARS